ncbi:MAG: hypothetical protein IT328_16175 [Caldilineaceae bacterium]|nr:hypothetical protein [Caldilineaceae bacterium]
MPASRYRLLRILAGLLIFILGCPPPNQPPREVIIQGIETIGRAGFTLLGEVFVLIPDSTGSFLLQVRDPNTGVPVENGTVTVSLSDPDGDNTRVFRGTTNEQGLVQVSFTVPENVTNPNQVLVVESRSTAGTAKYEESVYVGRAYNVLVSTDKPVYQPGQTIHIRTLALDTLALKATHDHEVTVTVSDPNGNKVARNTLTTSKYGVASTDFVVDSLATTGDYIITAEIGPVSSSRTVEVEPYTLPRFKVEFNSDKAFYLPGETATGVVDAQYFFGKPVSGGEVTIRGYVTDVDRFQVFEVNGTTDENGQYPYSFTVPDYFVGQLENNAAEVDLEITVVDTANHAESIDDTVTVAEKKILIEAIPESGTLRAGIENIIYVDTSYPDGRAAPSTIEVESPLLAEPLTLATDAYGLATFRMTPTVDVAPVITLTATTTPTGAAAPPDSAIQVLTLEADQTPTSVLLRPERAEYHIGDTMNLDIHVAGNSRTVYLDVIKGRQTFALVSLPVMDGIAQAAIDIDGSLLGTLELNAYVVNDQGEIVRDRRLVLVNPAPAQVEISSDAATYRPGETATVDFQVTRDGAPMTGALGISIVDESVFSVGTQDPGFARTYFLLERELLEPRYEIHNFTDLEDDEASPYDQNPDSVRYGLAPNTPAITPDPALIATSRNSALMGFFAEELGAIAAPILASPAAESVASAPTDAFAWGWLNRIVLMAPLLGLAFYDGTKSRRRLLVATVLFALATGFYAACSSGAPAAPAASQEAAASETTATRGTADAPRLRQYFPETLYWMPELETDAQGHAQVELPLADSITTWRVSVIASDEQGNLGSGQGSLRVFQEFFVEPDLPRFLTVGDEIDVPIALYNYLNTPQTIELSVKRAPWFEFRGDSALTIELGPNEVSAAYIPISVLDFGEQDFEITAIGEQASDAVLRTVSVVPNGRPQASVVNGQLEAAHSFEVAVPRNAIPGTGRVTVKLYPGIVSQAIDGLAGMLQEPYGCFEQTSSVNYPNVLVLDYLRATGQQSPDIELQAEFYINAGYQRLVTFEVPGSPGGFSLFGNPPPETMLTAYGLMQFSDMAHVYYVDPALLERTAQFLIDRQQRNGSWNPSGMRVSSSDSGEETGDISATAYIVWGLADAGFMNDLAVARGLTYLVENINIADTDSYVLAMAANAFAAADQPASGILGDILDELASRAISESDNGVRWSSTVTTWLREYGTIVDLETTSMATIAFLRSGQHLDLAERAIHYITSHRNNIGAYGSPHSTVMALKALLLAAQIGGEGGSATVTISLEGARTRTLTVDESNADVVQQVSFDDIGSDPVELLIEMEGDRAIHYQVSTDYYQPWPGPTSTPSTPQAPQGVRIDVAYDRTELAVNDIVEVTAEVEMLSEGVAGMVLVDLGVPPGFTPLTNDLDALVDRGIIERYELTGRQIIFYLEDVPSGQMYELTYRLQARFPIRAQTPPSTVYDYYTPEQRATESPQRIVVTLGTPQ